MSGEAEKRTESPWYREGLRFECTQCGKCCTGGDGYVWVSAAEIADLAVFVGTHYEAFLAKYVWQIGGELALMKTPAYSACVFLREGRCTVYGARPRQCRTFPFWPDSLRSAASWEGTAQRCEGIDDSAALVPFDEIERKREQTLQP